LGKAFNVKKYRGRIHAENELIPAVKRKILWAGTQEYVKETKRMPGRQIQKGGRNNSSGRQKGNRIFTHLAVIERRGPE
jgi:hypothetical protein